MPDDSGVRVDTAQIGRYLRREGVTSVTLRFAPESGSRGWAEARTEVLRAVNEAIRLANQEQPEPGGFMALDAVPGPGGPVLACMVAESVEEMRIWTARFARELEHGGWRGRVSLLHNQYPPLFRNRPVTMSAMVNIAGATPNDDPTIFGKPLGAWAHDRALADRLRSWAVSWVSPEGADIFLAIGLTSSQISTRDVAARVGAMDGRQSYCFTSNPDSDHARLVAFRGGRMCIQLHEPLFWRERLDVLRDAITEFADVSEGALIRQSYLSSVPSDIVAGTWPPSLPHLPYKSTSTYWGNRTGFDHEYVPDSYGSQILTDTHLARAHDLSTWNITDLGGGKHLVEAADLAVWFVTPYVEQHVVDRARADFGDIIMWAWDEKGGRPIGPRG